MSDDDHRRSIEDILEQMGTYVHDTHEDVSTGNQHQKGNDAVRKIKEAYDMLPIWREDENLSLPDDRDPIKIPEMYEQCCDLVSKITYDSDDIETFCNEELHRIDAGSPHCLNPATGLFISALINKEDIVGPITITNPPRSEYNRLGYRLGETKEALLNLKGIKGNHICQKMKRGCAYLDGCSIYHLGSGMEGGEIVVSGGFYFSPGSDMKGGEIRIRKDPKDPVEHIGHVGTGMKAGKIVVEGDAMDPGYAMKGGYLTLKGDAIGVAGDLMEGGTLDIIGNVEEIIDCKEKATILVGGDAKRIYGRNFDGRVFVKGDVHEYVTYGEENPNLSVAGRIRNYSRGLPAAEDSLDKYRRMLLDKP